MSQKEITLLDIIYRDDNPIEALHIAIEIITAFLESPGSFPEPSPVCFQELA